MTVGFKKGRRVLELLYMLVILNLITVTTQSLGGFPEFVGIKSSAFLIP